MTDPYEAADAGAGSAGPALQASDRFRLAWLEGEPELLEFELLPARLARATCEVLNVDGAGIGVLDGYFRVPLGASDDLASAAERLQFTAGEGPCLDAVQAHRPVSVTTEQIRSRWPQFAAQLFEQTPYRAVMSLPIGDADLSLGALDLYLVDADRLSSISAGDAIAVVEELYETLVATAAPAPGPLSGKPEPRWMHGHTAQSRMAVWIAIGALMAEHDISDPDALALLRAFAYSHNDTVDEIAQQLLHGPLTPEDFTP